MSQIIYAFAYFMSNVWLGLKILNRILTYYYIVNRHRYLGPWTIADILSQLSYIFINLFGLAFRVSSLSAAGTRAGNLSLINLIPVLAGAHLGFLADLIGVSLRLIRCIHRTAALMSSGLAATHAVIVLVGRFSIKTVGDIWGVTVSSLLAAKSLLTGRGCMFVCGNLSPVLGITEMVQDFPPGPPVIVYRPCDSLIFARAIRPFPDLFVRCRRPLLHDLGIAGVSSS
jgi:hypothetical protein